MEHKFRRFFVDHTWQPDPPLTQTLAELPAGAAICDLGARGRRVQSSAVCVNETAGPSVDVVAGLHDVPLPDEQFDLVICTGALNLCHNPRRVLGEAHRLLRPRGQLHLEVGLFQPHLPEPEDYWRFTLPGLRLLVHELGFEELRSGIHIGPASAFASGGAHLFGRLFSGPGMVNKAVRGAAHVALGPVKYLDALIPRNAWNKTPFAYGIYLVGQRV